ncbi:MAG: cation diffusion facilitator family transporter [Nibricoccus sp.]
MSEKISNHSSADVAHLARDSSRLVLRGIGLNATLAAVKIAGGVIGNTYALIADGVESLVDIFSSALVWAGLRVAMRPPDDNHPYGHGKAESLAGLAVALFMFCAAGWIGWHAVHEIRTPHHAPHWGTLPLLAGIIVVKYVFSRKLVEVGRQAGSTSLGIEAWHHLADALTSAAAFIGIAIAVVGGAGYESADDWAALAACPVIATNGITLARRALDDVMDVAVPREFEALIRATAATVPGVRGLEKCRIRKSGLQHIVDIHVEVDGRLSVHDGHEIARAVKRALIASPHRVSDVLVHIEPAAD